MYKISQKAIKVREKLLFVASKLSYKRDVVCVVYIGSISFDY